MQMDDVVKIEFYLFILLNEIANPKSRLKLNLDKSAGVASP